MVEFFAFVMFGVVLIIMFLVTVIQLARAWNNYLGFWKLVKKQDAILKKLDEIIEKVEGDGLND